MKKIVLLGTLLLAMAGCVTTPKTLPPADVGAASATLVIESEPAQARILYSKEEDGPWEEYQKAAGLHITPSTSELEPGEFFWIKVTKKGYLDSEPMFVRADGREKIPLMFVLDLQREKASMHVTSAPSGATVLAAKSADGLYAPWPEPTKNNLTPVSGSVVVGDTVWVKVMKEGYRDSDPQPAQPVNASPIHLSFTLVKPGEPPKGPQTARIKVTSNPSGATILVADEELGRYTPWPAAGAVHVTPLETTVNVGKVFWMKLRRDGYETSAPKPISVLNTMPIDVHADLTPLRRHSDARQPQPAPATVAPAPAAQAAVPAPAPARAVPAPAPAAPAPAPAVPAPAVPAPAPTVPAPAVPVPATAAPAPAVPAPVVPAPATVAPQAEGGIVADGFAIVKENAREARSRAILDALGAAIQEKYGAEITARSVSRNFVLMESRVESLAQGRFASYDVLEESQENGLYHVKLRVKLREDLLKTLQAQNVSVMVGGRESAQVGDERLTPNLARRAVADVLTGAGMQVSLNEEEVAEARQLAPLASREDLALYLGASCGERDKFGEFYSFKTDIDYALLTPETGHVVASGRVSGSNIKRELTAQGAASASLQDVGRTAAEQILDTLVQRYERSAAHTIFVVGNLDPRALDGLIAELGAIPGVKDARVCAVESGAVEIELVLSPEARRDVPNAVQRLRNAELDFVEGNLHTTVARVR